MMATFRVQLTAGKKGKGVSHCDYINREGQYGKEELASQLVANGVINLPAWAKTGREFFAAADIYERRNGCSYKAVDVALPCELTHEQNIVLAQRIMECLCKDKVGAWAIHSKAAITANAENIHLHTMLCERCVTDSGADIKPPELFFKRYNPKTPEKGGYKKDSRFNKPKNNKLLKEIRKQIADLINEAYRKAGLRIKVSAATIKEQKTKALSEGDAKLAKYCNRKPAKYIPFKEFKKLQTLASESGLLNYDVVIPTAVRRNPGKLDKLNDEDARLWDFLEERTEAQRRKLEYIRQITEDDATQLVLLTKNFKAVSTTQLKKSIEFLKSDIKLRHEHNIAYMNLVMRIYGGKENRLNFYRDYITRGKMKKIRRAKTRLKDLEKWKDELILIKEYYYEHPVNKKIEAVNGLINKLVDEINAEVKTPLGNERLRFAQKELTAKFPSRNEKYKRYMEENSVLKNMDKELQELILALGRADDTALYPASIIKKLQKALEQNAIDEVQTVCQDVLRQISYYSRENKEVSISKNGLGEKRLNNEKQHKKYEQDYSR